MRYVAVLCLVALTGCFSPSSVKQGSPDLTADYPTSDPTKVRNCVKNDLLRQSSGTATLKQYMDGKTAVLTFPLVGVWGPQGVVWIARFGQEQAKIFGGPNLTGTHGKELLPIIRQCTKS